MKKALSILLSVMMVAGLFIALIPTASATVKSDLLSAVAAPQYTLGEAWYSEDFESADASLIDADLFAALGWNNGGKTLPSSGMLAVVADGENQWVSLKGNATVIPLVTDSRLAGGDYYIEYTQKMTENTGTNGQGLGIVSGGYGTSAVVTSATKTPYGNQKLIWQWNVKHRGDLDTIAYYPGYAKYHNDFCHALDLDVPEETGVVGSTSTDETISGSILGEVIRFRIVIDSDYGFSAYTLDENGNATPIAYMASTTFIERWKANAASIADFFSFRILNGPTVLVDDIKVGSLVKEEKDTEPGLVISEFTSKGRESFTASDGVKHRLEWFEVYNASTEAKNIYDYAILRRNGFMKYNTSTSGAVSSDSLTNTISASEWFKISYPETEGGECVATRTDKTYEYKFTNPVYAKGVLQPGETAILVNASDWWNGLYNPDSLTATTDVFKNDILKNAKLNYSDEAIANMKIFNCSAGKGSTSFGIDNEGYTLIGLAPLAEDGTCPAEGQHFYDSEYVDNYIIDIKKKSNTTYNHAYLAGYLRYSYTPAEYYTQEYNSFDANGNYLGTGLAVSGKAPGNGTHSMGYVPEAYRRTFKVTYVSDDETFESDKAYLATAYNLTTSVPTKAGYKFTGWVDAQGNPATNIAAADMLGDVTFYATWEQTNVAKWVGSQNTVMGSDNKFDLRLVASIEDLTNVETIAFVISVNGGAEKTVYLRYVYESVSTDFGGGIYKPESGYVVALAINGCHADAVLNIKVMTVYTDETVQVGDAHEAKFVEIIR